MVTEDGYILEMHRIPHGRQQEHRDARIYRTPILLQHGLAGSSADWVLTGPDKALGAHLNYINNNLINPYNFIYHKNFFVNNY